MKSKVAVAMSGGVDSSVAALLLKQAGYDVFGVMLRLWTESEKQPNRCCPPSAVHDAREIAGMLGIPFYVLDYKEEFKTRIVDYFTASYLEGVTPNPCIYCNKDIRFGKLLDEATKLGATHLATGHYARLEDSGDGPRMLRGLDPDKDQSYMLYRLSQSQLERAYFPAGEYRKPEIREMARKAGLPTHSKEDSQDLCFLGDDGHRGFLQRNTSEASRPGDMVLADGTVVGNHLGLPFYTIGQRKGLGVAWKEPLFVIEKNLEKNLLVVGGKSETFSPSFTAKALHLTGKEDCMNEEVDVQTRYKGRTVKAKVTLLPNRRVSVELLQPVSGITPGQSAVFYQGDTLLGGAIIELPSQQ